MSYDNEPRVEIHWLDSGLQHAAGWMDRDELEQSRLSVVETVGYLVSECDDTYYVALTRDRKNSHYYGIQLIHKGNVRAFKLLRER